MNALHKTADAVISVAPKDLADSPYQKARVSDRGNVEEMAASMREVGVLEPLLARPQPTRLEAYELVCGHRRKRAALLAGLSAVPVIVREYTDDQVLEIQAIENGQREGVHPLDEADLFAELVKRGKSVEHIADKVGRPTSFVRQRLQLEHLQPEAREAFDAGRLLLGPALQLARIPSRELQLEALEQVAADPEHDDDEGMSAKRAGEYIRDRFMLRLASAPFDRASELLTHAGACTSCHKRTGNQTELFSDVDSPDLCTDPSCYREKVDAHWELLKKQAKRDGKAVLAEKDAAKVFSDYSEQTVYGSAWLPIEGTTYVGSKGVRVGSLLKGTEYEVTLARNPRSGKIHELVPRKLVEKLAAAKSKEQAKAAAVKNAAKQTAAQKAKAEAAEHKQAIENKARDLCVAAVVAKVEKLGPTADVALFELLLRDMLDQHEGPVYAFERRGLIEPDSPVRRGVIDGYAEKYAKDASADQLRAFIAECVLSVLIVDSYGPDRGKAAAAFCKAIGVDAPNTYDKRAAAALKEETAAKAREQAEANAPKAKPAKASKPKPSKKGGRR